MNKKIIYIIIIIINIICLCNISNNRNNNDNSSEEPPSYDAKMVCIKNTDSLVDEESVSSTSKIYINYDDNNVLDSTYQIITVSDSFYKSRIEMIQGYLNLYNGINGITYNVYQYNNSIVTTIKYDYTKIDLNILRTKLGSILDEDSIFNNIDYLPFSLDTYKKYELYDYSCK